MMTITLKKVAKTLQTTDILHCIIFLKRLKSNSVQPISRRFVKYVGLAKPVRGRPGFLAEDRVSKVSIKLALQRTTRIFPVSILARLFRGLASDVCADLPPSNSIALVIPDYATGHPVLFCWILSLRSMIATDSMPFLPTTTHFVPNAMLSIMSGSWPEEQRKTKQITKRKISKTLKINTIPIM